MYVYAYIVKLQSKSDAMAANMNLNQCLWILPRFGTRDCSETCFWKWDKIVNVYYDDLQKLAVTRDLRLLCIKNESQLHVIWFYSWLMLIDYRTTMSSLYKMDHMAVRYLFGGKTKNKFLVICNTFDSRQDFKSSGIERKWINFWLFFFVLKMENSMLMSF